jgi:hypothetical protein
VTAVEETQVPVITVIRGRPTPAELAAAVAVLLAAAASAPGPAPAAARSSAWVEHFRTPHGLPRPGPHSWRASALPR